MTMFSMQQHDNPNGTVLAACDADLLGETFEDGPITLHVDEDFYGGDDATLDEIVAALTRADTANLVGNELIAGLIEADAVDDSAVMTVDTVKHVQLVFL